MKSAFKQFYILLCSLILIICFTGVKSSCLASECSSLKNKSHCNSKFYHDVEDTTGSSIDVYIKNIDEITIDSNNKNWFDKYILQNLITLIIAVISFFLSQLYFRIKDKNLDIKKYLSHLKIIVEEIKRNLDFECQLHAYIYVNIMPTFGLSFFVSQNILYDFSRISKNYTILKALFAKYFEYNHIQNRINQLYEVAEKVAQLQADTTTGAQTLQKWLDRYDNEKIGTLKLINGNIPGSLNLYNSIIEEISKYETQSEYKILESSYLDEKYDEYQADVDVVGSAQYSRIDLNNREKHH